MAYGQTRPLRNILSGQQTLHKSIPLFLRDWSHPILPFSREPTVTGWSHSASPPSKTATLDYGAVTHEKTGTDEQHRILPDEKRAQMEGEIPETRPFLDQ